MNTLENHKEKPLFDVPEHYFEKMQHDVIQRIIREEKYRKSSKKWISAISIAASVAIIVVLSVYLVINRDTDEHFYVYEEVTQSETPVIAQEINHFAEVEEAIVNEIIEEPLSSKTSSVADETIVYRAVDFYIDDYEIYNFCEVMYELECFYEY